MSVTVVNENSFMFVIDPRQGGIWAGGEGIL